MVVLIFLVIVYVNILVSWFFIYFSDRTIGVTGEITAIDVYFSGSKCLLRVNNWLIIGI